MVVRAVARIKVRGALAGGDAAGGLDAGCREPMIGGQGTGARMAGFFERNAFAERLACSPGKAAELLGISTELVHDLLRTGQLGSVKAGRAD